MSRARLKIVGAVLEAVDSLEEGITNIEFAIILSELPKDLALKWSLREERHGTTDKKADEA